MKKNYLSLIATAMMFLGFSSCSQEEPLAPVAGDMTTFKISLEGTSHSRAAGNAEYIDNLYYEVYQGGTKILDNYGEGANADPVTVTDGVASVDMPLLKGEKYKIMFWAQKEDAIYTVDNLQNITVEYTDAEANQEAYDAFFYGDDDFQATSNVTTIELRRPFGQLRIGTTVQDWTTANSVISGTDAVTESSIKVKGLAKTFNVLTGKATDDAGEVIFEMSSINKEYLGTFTVKKDGVDVDYKYLSMNYLLVPSSENVHKSNLFLTATFRRGDHDLFSLELPNVTVERNWRTNIMGNLLAADKTFEVVILPGFDGSDYNYPNTVKEHLYMAAAIGGEVTLTEDVVLDEPLVAVCDMTVNLNGFTISGGKDFVPNTGMTGTDISGIVVDKGAHLILDGQTGSVKGAEYGVYVKNGMLTIKDGNYEGKTSAVQIGKGTANIEGGKFSVTDTDKRYVINCLDNDWKNGYAKVNITGGTFKGFDPSNNVAEGTGTNFVPEGYQVTNSGEGYIVSLSDGPDFVDKGDYYEVYKPAGMLKWAYAVNNSNDDLGLKLMRDIEMPAYEIELDAANGTYKFTETAITVDADGKPSGSNWIPVRNNADANGTYFSGLIDGNNYTLKGLFINYNNLTAGLIGYMEGGTIQNLKLENANVYSTSSYVGAFVGYNEDNSSVINCHLLNSQVVGNKLVGGIVGGIWTKDNGKASAIIKGCTTDGLTKVRGTGGTGGNGGSLRGTGGIAGQNWGGIIIECKNAATVDGLCYIGGIVGSTRPSDTSQGNRNGYIIACENSGSISAAESVVGGIAGENIKNALCSYIVGCSSTSSSIVGGSKGLLVGSNNNSYMYSCWAKDIDGVNLCGYSSYDEALFKFSSVNDVNDANTASMNAAIDNYNQITGVEICSYTWVLESGNWPKLKKN